MSFSINKYQPIAGRRIGLFGGSFNPAHYGHFSLAKMAMARLQLDYVWWMVSPQNPLKLADETSDFDERMAVAREVANHPRFIVCDFERDLGTTTTAQTFVKLSRVFEQGDFVWLMGADSFAGLHRWNDWQTILQTLPVAVFDRPEWGSRALGSVAAQIYKNHQYAGEDAALLVGAKTPSWCFVPMSQRVESSTAIRKRAKL